VFWSLFYFFIVNYGLSVATMSIEVGHKAEYSSITLAFVRTITRMVDDTTESNNSHPKTQSYLLLKFFYELL